MDGTFDRDALSTEAILLLDVLLRYANSTGRAQASSSDLLKGSGLTQGGLVRARGELARSGLMRVEPGFSPSGLRGANIYALDILTITEPSGSSFQGESTRNETKGFVLPGHPDSEEVPVPSGRHRSGGRGFWSRFLRGSGTS
jgi:hypothetical protein